MCPICEFNNNKQRHQIEEKVLRQDRNFPTRIIYLKEVNEIYLSMVNNKYKKTKDMNIKLKSLKGTTKLKFFQIFGKY